MGAKRSAANYDLTVEIRFTLPTSPFEQNMFCLAYDLTFRPAFGSDLQHHQTLTSCRIAAKNGSEKDSDAQRISVMRFQEYYFVVLLLLLERSSSKRARKRHEKVDETEKTTTETIFTPC